MVAGSTAAARAVAQPTAGTFAFKAFARTAAFAALAFAAFLTAGSPSPAATDVSIGCRTFRCRFEFGSRFFNRFGWFDRFFLRLRNRFFNRLRFFFRLLNIGIRLFRYDRFDNRFRAFYRLGFRRLYFFRFRLGFRRLRLRLRRSGILRGGGRTRSFGIPVSATEIAQIDKLDVLNFHGRRHMCAPQQRHQADMQQRHSGNHCGV